ncbi:hypothetical protein BDF14DRAFT_1802461 [Spinellus fusiger]|nr:hypothetical protein BDF14DRAFT_1802461 [Spinellus fusiger]
MFLMFLLPFIMSFDAISSLMFFFVRHRSTEKENQWFISFLSHNNRHLLALAHISTHEIKS